jgi:hypothetical protein
MGYQTAVTILNDAVDQLKTDVGFGPRLLDAILISQRPEYRERGVDVSLGNHCNAVMVLPSHHADVVQVVAVGGNYMRPLGNLYGAWRNMQEPEKLLKELADQMGYRLVRKAQR